MPYYDRMGPRGEGPMTGGGFGYCRSAGRRFRAWPLVGLGVGLGALRYARRWMRGNRRGYRMGMGYGPYADGAVDPWMTPASEEEAAAMESDALTAEAEGLRREAKALQRELEAVESRLAALREVKDDNGQVE